MQYTINDVFAYQLLHYLITQYQYEMVRIQNQKNDFWLMNPEISEFPIICITHENYSDVPADEAYLRNIHRAILDVIGREGKLLILNTNQASVMFEKDFMMQLIAVPSEINNHDLLQTFSGIDQIPHQVEDPQTECATLTRLLEEYEISHSQKGKRRMKIKIPKVTAGIAIICFVYFLFIQGLTVFFQNIPASIIAGGAYYKMSVIAMGEYWRIFTTGFLHFDVFHLFINLYTFFSIGLVCEKLYTMKQYITIFIGSLFFGSIFAFIADGNVVNVGIGPGIFGVMAAFIVVLVDNESIRLPIVRRSVSRLLFLIILLTMMPNTSFMSDIGAAITGAFLGFMFTGNVRWKNLRKHTTIAFSALLVCLVFFASRVQRIEPVDKEMDTTLIQGFEKVGWNDYANQMKTKFEVVYEREMAK